MLFATLITLTAFAAGEPSARSTDRWVVHDKHGVVEIYAEFDPGVSELWSEIESVQQELRQLLDVRPSGEAVQIMLFSSRARYQRYLISTIPEAQYRRAVFYRNGDVFQVYAFRSATLITDLRHEFAHVLLHQYLQFLPLWIDEGLAEFCEERASERGQSVRLAGVRWKSRFGWAPSLKSLENLPSAAQMTADDYRDSWAWVTFLLQESPESRAILKEYLRVISRGEAPEPFSRFLAGRDSSAENRIKSYFRKFQIPLSSGFQSN